MERAPIKTILALLVGLFIMMMICGGLMLVLAGDNLLSTAQTTIIRLSLTFRDDDLNQTISDDNTPIRFTVSSGDSAFAIGRNLREEGLINDANLFTDYVRAERLDGQLEAGTYFLNEAMNIRQIALALTDSRFSQITFTILPGQRIEEVARSIDANSLFAFTGAEFLSVVGHGAVVDPEFTAWAGLPPGVSLEGFLYPDTYSLPPEVTPEMLRDILLESFRLAITDDMEAGATAAGLSLYEVVTLASIVQREANRSDESPKIAGAYLNRMNIGMRLDADPTVQYPLGSSENWWPRITQADYQGVISDYNTYRNTGLPPGPIANPGLTAIRAVIEPEESNYFFFRADCRDDGYHDFAVTYEEHLANGC